jgi:hypothetical protein
VPDWVYEFVEAFVGYMDQVTLFDALALMLLSTTVVPFVVLIHEAGHALVAFGLRRRVVELVVGDDAPLLTMRVGGFRLRLGAISGKGGAAGLIRYDGARASPRATLAIALGGPLASLAGAAATGAAAVWVWPDLLSVFFALATLAGLTCCVGTLRVRGDGPASWSDGVWVRAAWRVIRSPTPVAPGAVWSEPREATSIPPPHQ